MPNNKGIWNQDEANQHHAFDYYLAKWIGQHLDKSEMVIDMGCGIATYIKYFLDIGFKLVLGIEGKLLDNFETPRVWVKDLCKPIRFKNISGNVLCLEVGEHIPEQYLEIFLQNLLAPLVDGSKLILSWAVPGQEGIGHVSCRSNEWVISEMESRGLKYLPDETDECRKNTSNHCAYFRETIMIFQK